jgi:SAM-dependent methyltransferase
VRFARCARPPRVVDLGCGTGLSTRIWAAHAVEVVGIDRSEPMLAEARESTHEPNVHYLRGDAANTGLPPESVDIAVAVQSFHWMDPTSTLAEIARTLRPGGVFAAADTVFPPAIDPELDVAFARFLLLASEHLGGDDCAPRWSKEGHLRRMHESGRFRHVRETEVHSVERGDASRFIGFAESAVDMTSLRDRGFSDRDIGLDDLAAVAARALPGEQDWIFGYRVRIAVK